MRLENYEICRWEFDHDTCSWDTECERKFGFIEGTPTDNEYIYCPGCGNRIMEKPVDCG